MNTIQRITTGGHHESISITGTNRNTQVGLHVDVPELQLVSLGKVIISNVFIPIIKTGKGRLTWQSIHGSNYGGDFTNLRAGNIFGQELVSRFNTPTRPYRTCVRAGNESIEACLFRHGEVVYDPGLLSFTTHPLYPGKEILGGYHCDGIAQIYSVLPDGHTLDPNGTIDNIEIRSIDVELHGKNTQALIGSEVNRYTNIRIGADKYHVKTDGYPYHALFNQLDNSTIGGKDNRVTIGSKIRVLAAKPTKFKSYNNHFPGFSNKDLIGVTMNDTLEQIKQVKDMQRHLAWLGLYTAPIDGDHGRKTQTALDEFMELEGYDGDIMGNLRDVVGRFTLPAYTNKFELADAVRVVCKQMYKTKIVYPAYMMATVEHETAGQFVPLEEGDHLSRAAAERVRSKLRYAPWWARGLVGLTHDYNYEKYGELLGFDLRNNPEVALDNDLALYILVHGMITGTFTNKTMGQYILGENADIINMRRVVNGVRKNERTPDKAELIATYYNKWKAYYENK